MKSQEPSTNGQISSIRSALEALPADSPQILAYGAFFAEGHDTGLHDHARAQFVHAESGLLRVWTVEGQWSVPPGMAVWVPAGVTHRVNAVSDADFVSLYIRKVAAGERSISIPQHCTVVSVPPLLRQLIVRLKELSDLPWSPRQERLACVIADELDELVPADLHLPVPVDRRAAAVALALIESPADMRDLAAWGRMAGASGKTLTRLFLDETGLTFAEWRQRCRLLAAVEWLAAGHSVTEAALDCGYRSPSAFTVAFTKAFGAPPTRYAPVKSGPRPAPAVRSHPRSAARERSVPAPGR